MKAKAGVLGESSGRSLSKAVGPPSHCSSPFPQGLEAAHAAQHQLWVVLVGVHFLIIGHESIFPLVQLLIPGSLDLLPGRKERTAEMVLVREDLLTRGALVAQTVKNPPAMWETWVRSLGRKTRSPPPPAPPSEKGMATHSSVLAWRIPWTEEPCGLQSMGSQRVNDQP